MLTILLPVPLFPTVAHDSSLPVQTLCAQLKSVFWRTAMGRAEKTLIALKAQPKAYRDFDIPDGLEIQLVFYWILLVFNSPPVQKEFPPFLQPKGVPHWYIPSCLLSSLLFLLGTSVLPSNGLRRGERLWCHVETSNFPMWRWYHGPDCVLSACLISLPVEKQYQFCGVKGWSRNNALCIVKQATSPVLYK